MLKTIRNAWMNFDAPIRRADREPGHRHEPALDPARQPARGEDEQRDDEK